jgi:small GTP-binding protein
MLRPGSADLKLITLGETQVGKTQVMRRYFEDAFDGDGVATIAADQYSKLIIWAGQPHTLCAWDTAGQERYRAITRSLYRDSHAVILVYDVTSQDSFDALRGWFTEIDDYAPANVPVVIVGNKLDLGQTVPFDDALAFAERMGAKLCLTSAKTGEGIRDLFKGLITLAIQFKTGSKEMTVRQGPVPVPCQVADGPKGQDCC